MGWIIAILILVLLIAVMPVCGKPRDYRRELEERRKQEKSHDLMIEKRRDKWFEDNSDY